MKKVSFKQFKYYSGEEVEFLPDEVFVQHFTDVVTMAGNYMCTSSFTAEITVKIVPYEQV